MADRPSPYSADGPDVGRGARPPTPRWVKVFAVVAAVVILLFLVLLLTGDDHGPRRHLGQGGGVNRAASAAVATP